MADPVRIGIVGCGSVMRAYMSLAKELGEQGLVEVTAACDTQAEQREQMRDAFGVPRVTDDYANVVGADDVDLVLVLTSMVEHGAITRVALEAGKHVLVEKPMAVELEEAAQLVALSQESKGHLLPAPHVLLSPTYQTIWRRLHRQDIGQVALVRARYGHSGPTWGPWFYKAGGGPVFDLGVYNVATLTGWLGPVRRVTAMMGVVIPERVVDGERVQVASEDNAQILLDFGGSVFAVVTTGFTMQKSRGPSIEIYGTSGTIQMGGYDWGPDGYEIWQNDEGAWQLFDETARRWPWTDGLRHLVECILDGSAPIITPEHGYHILEVMTRAKEAAADGRTREVESSFVPPTFWEPGEEGTPAHLIHDPER